jgi:DNA processing protein
VPIWPVRTAGAASVPRLEGLAGIPAQLYLLGELPGGPAIALIGTRDPDATGVGVASRVAVQAARAGWVIVSGLSPGVDWVSLEAAVAVGGRCVAVIPEALAGLAGERAELAGRILAVGGCLVSAESSSRDPSSRGARLRRDPVISGLSHLVLVVQARQPDGTLAAAAHALRQGRPLWVVEPGRGPSWRGSRWLLSVRAPLVRPGPRSANWPLAPGCQPGQPAT